MKDCNDPKRLYKMKPIHVMVAHDSSYGIGLHGKIPWKCPLDMQHFRTVTSRTQDPLKQNAVLMGRTTYNSFTSPLKNRLNVCVSRIAAANCTDTASSKFYECMPRAIEELQADASIESIFIIGGVQIYKEAFETLPIHSIYVTTLFVQVPTDCSIPFLPDFLKTRSFESVFSTDDFECLRYF